MFRLYAKSLQWLLAVLLLLAHPASGLAQEQVAEDAEIPAQTEVRDPEPEREQSDEKAREPHVWRALAETGVLMSIGTIWYLAGQDINRKDWDFKLEMEDLGRKFLSFEQVRFDNNTYLFNQIYHPISYMGIYIFTRANNLGVWSSFAFAVVSAVFWEYVGEIREKVSINDLITSPWAGLAWGEVAYDYGEYFASPESSGKTMDKILTAVPGIPRTLHNWLDDVEPNVWRPRRFFPTFGPTLDLRLREPLEPRRANPQTVVGVRLDTKMSEMEGYGDAETFTRTFADGNFSRVDFESVAGEEGLHDLRFRAQTTLIGRYAQNMRVRADGALEGTRTMIGGSTAYDVVYRDHQLMRDRQGVVHLFGPTLWLQTLDARGARVDFRTDVFADFAAIRSLAYPQFLAAHGDEGIRTDLKEQSYYFAYGYSLLPSLAVHFSRISLGGDLRFGRYHSINGRDRFQEEVTRRIVLADTVLDARLWARLDLWRKLGLRLAYDVVQRDSAIEQLREERGFRQFSIGVDGALGYD